jgi:hypothetical protein
MPSSTRRGVNAPNAFRQKSCCIEDRIACLAIAQCSLVPVALRFTRPNRS